MIYYSNNGNEIQIDMISNDIVLDKEHDTFTVTLPTITCTDYKQAKTIQETVNLTIQRMSKILLNLDNEEEQHE